MGKKIWLSLHARNFISDKIAVRTSATSFMRMWNGTLARSPRHIKVSLSSDVFERWTSTGSRIFALLIRDFEQIFEQIVSIRVKKLSNTNLVVSRNIKREKG